MKLCLNTPATAAPEHDMNCEGGTRPVVGDVASVDVSDSDSSWPLAVSTCALAAGTAVKSGMLAAKATLKVAAAAGYAAVKTGIVCAKAAYSSLRLLLSAVFLLGTVAVCGFNLPSPFATKVTERSAWAGNNKPKVKDDRPRET